MFARSAGLPAFRPVRDRLMTIVVALVLTIVLGLSGFGSDVEQALQTVRDQMVRRSASGQIIFVAIDAKSLKVNDRWPWDRSTYARLADRLGQAGVDTIAFDIDLSSRSSPKADQELASAVKRFPGTIIFPTFRQRENSDDSGFVENLPIQPLREHAFLAAVNVHPDPDGILRTYSFGERTDHVARPSMGAMLAGKAGSIGRDFVIDQSIDPSSIPTFSFTDILNGKFDRRAFVGKRVIVGASAIELGDRYAVPSNGLVAGPLVQALAAETLLVGRPFSSAGAIPLSILAALALFAIARLDRWETRMLAALALCFVALCFQVAVEGIGLAALHIVPALVLIATTCAGWGIFDFLRAIRGAERQDGRTGLPNGMAMVEAASHQDECAVVTVCFPRLAEAMAILSEGERRDLILRIAARLQVAANDQTVYLDRGDAFCWIWPGHPDDQMMNDQSSAMAALFLSPLTMGEKQIAVTPRIGFARSSGSEMNDVLARAVNAAKEAQSRDCLWIVDNESVNDNAARSQQLLGNLRSALQEQEFWVAYQPKLAFMTGEIIGAEALMRWASPQLGAISPGEFIPLLEGERLMEEPTLFVLDTVLADLERWQIDGHSLNIAINISTTLLGEERFIQSVEQRLTRHAALLKWLTFEVTESAAIGDGDGVSSVLQRWRDKGIRVSIDDYGTGQSTLSYLKSFPANEIKVDQSFVRNLPTSRSDQILVRSTIELAHELGMKVVAEGIEDQVCFDLLAQMGCDVGQGWHIGKPMPVRGFDAMLQQVFSPASPITAVAS